MEATQELDSTELAPELMSVSQAAGERLRADVDGDEEATAAAAQAMLEAATVAMRSGYSLSEITEAETRGKAEVRNALRPDTLMHVERTGNDMRAAQTEHHQSIARAVRLGLSTRQIAAAAGLTHGTVRAITTRLSKQGALEGAEEENGAWDDQQPGEQGEGDW